MCKKFMKAKATVLLPFQPGKRLNSVVAALEPEINRQIGVRSKTVFRTKENDLILEVEAEDTVALRAALNSYLRWVNSTLNVIDTVS